MKSIFLWLAVLMATYGVVVPKIDAAPVCTTYGDLTTCTDIHGPVNITCIKYGGTTTCN